MAGRVICESFGEGIDRFFPLGEKIEQRASRRVRNRVKHVLSVARALLAGGVGVGHTTRKHSLTTLYVSTYLRVKIFFVYSDSTFNFST